MVVYNINFWWGQPFQTSRFKLFSPRIVKLSWWTKPDKCLPMNSRILVYPVNDVVLVSLLLTFNRFHKSFWCFYRWLWASKCRLGMCWVSEFGGYNPSGNGYWNFETSLLTTLWWWHEHCLFWRLTASPTLGV